MNDQPTQAPSESAAKPAPAKPLFTGEIASVPHMEPSGRKMLGEHLKTARIFLEYGSGGSSVMASATSVSRIYSVDSDKVFLEAVEAKIMSTGVTAGRYIPIHADIGPTGDWGVPLDRTTAGKWPSYVNRPWQVMGKAGDAPDLILIDGRFRAASFLLSYLLAPEGCVILFDDYFDRPSYHVVERYLPHAERAGRMARFVVPAERSKGAIQELLVNCTRPL